MKKVAIFVLLMLVSAHAYAVERNGRKAQTQLVLQGGDESITSTSYQLNTTPWTAQQPVSANTPCSKAFVCASRDNTNVVYVGGSTVLGGGDKNKSAVNGIPIGTGTSVDRCVTLAVDNVNKIYVAGSSTRDGVLITYTEFV